MNVFQSLAREVSDMLSPHPVLGYSRAQKIVILIGSLMLIVAGVLCDYYYQKAVVRDAIREERREEPPRR